MTRLHTFLKRAALLVLAVSSFAALAQPVPIRIGHGAAAEESLWLVKAAPKIAVNQGKAYTADFNLFRGSDKRFQAFEAGELDIITSSTHSVMMAAAEGMKFKIVASISREGGKGFATQYMVKNDSPIKSIADLKGKTVGINAARSSIEIWARMAIEKKGLNPERDIRWVTLPFPSQGEAVRAGKMDVGAFPQPFAAIEEKRGGLRTIFTSSDGIPREEDLIVLLVSEKFAAQHPAALKAFLADVVRESDYYVNNRAAASKQLLDAGFVSLPLDTYLMMKDYQRPLDSHVNKDSMKNMIVELTKFGFITKKFDLDSYVDMSYLPR